MLEQLEQIVPYNNCPEVEKAHEAYTAASDYLNELLRQHAAIEDQYILIRKDAQEKATGGESSPAEIAAARQAARDAEANRDTLAADIKEQERAVSDLNDAWRAEMREAKTRNREKANRIFDKAL